MRLPGTRSGDHLIWRQATSRVDLPRDLVPLSIATLIHHQNEDVDVEWIWGAPEVGT